MGWTMAKACQKLCYHGDALECGKIMSQSFGIYTGEREPQPCDCECHNPGFTGDFSDGTRAYHVVWKKLVEGKTNDPGAV